MKLLITSDIHLTDRPRDEYRWGLFPFLVEIAAGAGADLAILGDLTDAKDRHSARLVNRIVETLKATVRDGPDNIYILKGNHDFLDPRQPFFSFLTEIAGVEFIVEPKYYPGFAHFLPYTPTPTEDWEKLDLDHKPGYIFTHQTYHGAHAENGEVLSGIAPSFFAGLGGMVFSGDIHVPQMVGPVEYIGAPYHVHFGDGFTPRVLLFDLNTGKRRDWYYPAPRKLVLSVEHPDELRNADVLPKDQVKVRLRLRKSDYVDWAGHRKAVVQIADELEWDLCGGIELEPVKERTRKRLGQTQPEAKGLSIADAFMRFCASEKLSPETVTVGMELLGEQQ